MKIEATEAKGWFQLGCSLTSLNKNLRALDSFRKATKLAPSSANALFNFAVTLLNLNETQEVETALLKVINLDNTYEDAYVYLGLYYAYLNDYKNAILQWKAVLKINPENYDARANIQYALEQEMVIVENQLDVA